MTQRLTGMRNGTIARMYLGNRIYSPAVTKSSGLIISAPHNGSRIAIQAKSIPPLADYEKWLRSGNCIWGVKISPAKIRRIVIMRRQGSTWRECGEAVGVSGSCAKNWVEFLPLDLAV